MSLIESFLTGEYKVKRTGVGRYVDGMYQKGCIEEFCVCGSLQPTNARELKLPTEGARLKQYWKFYSDKPIVAASARSLADSDIVFINGDEYRAMSLTTWEGTDLDYHMTILLREPQQRSDGKAAG